MRTRHPGTNGAFYFFFYARGAENKDGFGWFVNQNLWLFLGKRGLAAACRILYRLPQLKNRIGDAQQDDGTEID